MVAVPLDPLPPALFQTHPDLQDPQTGRSISGLSDMPLTHRLSWKEAGV